MYYGNVCTSVIISTFLHVGFQLLEASPPHPTMFLPLESSIRLLSVLRNLVLPLVTEFLKTQLHAIKCNEKHRTALIM